MTKRVTQNGSRFYVDPGTGKKLPGVTSVVGMLPKDFLRYWAAKVVAEEAYDSFSALASFVSDGKRSAAVDWLKRSPNRPKDEAALRGTEVHELTEQIDELGGVPRRLSSRLMPYALGYLGFLESAEPEIVSSELAVVSREHGYAGTLDRVVKIGGATHVLDIKTSKAVYAETALQISAYRNADHCIVGDELREWSSGAGKTGLVLQLRPDYWRLVPVDVGPSVFGVFLSLLGVFEWKSLEKIVLGAEMFGAEFEETEVMALENILRSGKRSG